MSIAFLRRALARVPTIVVASALGLSVAAASGCDSESAAAPTESAVNPTLRVHEVLPSTPTAEGLAYVRAMAAAHLQADGLSAQSRQAVLRAALAQPVPSDLPEAEILRLETATRLAEDLIGESKQGEGVAVARDVLAPMLAPSRSLPLDRTTARALVVLGDAAAKTGDDALAAGSYARAIRMMSILRQELEQ